jgi:hypothetical protein
MTLSIPTLRSCSAAHLRAHGQTGCPTQSQIGTGHAVMAVHAGSQTIMEDVTLKAFLGPLGSDSQPTFEVVAQGYTPLDRRVVLTGTVLPTHAPFGEELVLSIPPVPSLPFEPDASILTFSLTVGARGRHATHDARAPTGNTVIVPSSCPLGGFPFAAEFTYADGSRGSALSTISCPTPSRPAATTATVATPATTATTATTARTISLSETGHLHRTSQHGFTLNERGSASGTLAGTIYVHLTVASTSRVTAEVSIYSHGGSITGYGSASYHRGEAAANFSGSLSISRGSGSYAHAHGSNLRFSGDIQRSNDSVTVQVNGRMSD